MHAVVPDQACMPPGTGAGMVRILETRGGKRQPTEAESGFSRFGFCSIPA